jgi:adenylyltransferase/sulfurtransferase
LFAAILIAVDDRYSRQILFGGIGDEGQRRLFAARILVIGCGALGSAHAESLARAGVGHLRIVDRDFVEPSNLQRPPLITCAKSIQQLRSNLTSSTSIIQISSN